MPDPAPHAAGETRPAERPISDFRYVNEKVAYEKLADKGLRRDQVAPAHPISFGRPMPAPLFAAVGRAPEKNGSVTRRQVRVQLLEEAGVDRSSAWIQFGFPLPKGALFMRSRS